MAFLFGTPCTVDIELANGENRKQVTIQLENTSEVYPLYVGDETVKGVVRVKPKEGKKVEHQGVIIEFIGQIEMFYERGNNYEFMNVLQELDPAGEITSPKDYNFTFEKLEKQFESYNGINVRLRYFLKVTVKRGLVSNVTKESDIWVRNFQTVPEINNSIKMEVGIEDCLHIEFEYNRSKYHLKDVIIGKIYFLLVRIKIKHMELAIIKRESTGSGPNLYNESETITKYEIMDGAPVRGESIPIRLFLSPFDLTPTYRTVHNKFSLKYYLNLVLVDEEDRRYFKQQEIVLWRKSDKRKRRKKGAKKKKKKESKKNEIAAEKNDESGGGGASAEKEEAEESKESKLIEDASTPDDEISFTS